jgi:hydroxyacylglutathione hydrolase
MEVGNVEGPAYDERAALEALTPADLERVRLAGTVVLDTRSIEAHAGSHVPGSLAISSDALGGWAGVFLAPRVEFALVSDAPETDTVRLARMGFDRVAGFLAGGMLAWEMSGRHVEHTATLGTPDVCVKLDADASVRILDVRSDGEVAALEIPDAVHIHLPDLPDRLADIPPDGELAVFCGSGVRSMIAASLLERAGRDSEVVLGGTAGWSSARCPLKPRDAGHHPS